MAAPKYNPNDQLETSRAGDRFALGTGTPVTAAKTFASAASPAAVQLMASSVWMTTISRMLVQNTGSTSLYIGWDATITSSSGSLKIAPGDVWEAFFNTGSTQRPFIVAAANEALDYRVVDYPAGA
jgi:hypothetical protein